MFFSACRGFLFARASGGCPCLAHSHKLVDGGSARDSLGILKNQLLARLEVLLPTIFDPSEMRSDFNGKVIRDLHRNETPAPKLMVFLWRT